MSTIDAIFFWIGLISVGVALVVITVTVTASLLDWLERTTARHGLDEHLGPRSPVDVSQLFWRSENVRQGLPVDVARGFDHDLREIFELPEVGKWGQV